jgi:hypothetical protein
VGGGTVQDPSQLEPPHCPPAGCTVVTIHQLPVALGRQGCTEVLLKAAQQPGEVVCEFLGGSRTMGTQHCHARQRTQWWHG